MSLSVGPRPLPLIRALPDPARLARLAFLLRFLYHFASLEHKGPSNEQLAAFNIKNRAFFMQMFGIGDMQQDGLLLLKLKSQQAKRDTLASELQLLKVEERRSQSRRVGRRQELGRMVKHFKGQAERTGKQNELNETRYGGRPFYRQISHQKKETGHLLRSRARLVDLIAEKEDELRRRRAQIAERQRQELSL